MLGTGIEPDTLHALRGLHEMLRLEGDRAYPLNGRTDAATQVNAVIAAYLARIFEAKLCRVVAGQATYVTSEGRDLVIVAGAALNLGLAGVALRKGGAWQADPPAPTTGLARLVEVVARTVVPRHILIEAEGLRHEFVVRAGALRDEAGSLPRLLDALRAGRSVRYTLMPGDSGAIGHCDLVATLSTGDAPGQIDPDGWPMGPVGRSAGAVRDALRVAQLIGSMAEAGPVAVDIPGTGGRMTTAAVRNDVGVITLPLRAKVKSS